MTQAAQETRRAPTHVHDTAIIHRGVDIGEGCIIEPYVILGSRTRAPLIIEDGAVIRSGTRIYGGVTIGKLFETGHNTLIRGDVTIGERCRVGSYSSVEGVVMIGDDTVIRGRCEIPNSKVGERVQIYACTMFYDTPHPPHGENQPPTVEDDVVLCCQVAVFGGVTVGHGSMVAANALVTRDVPPDSFVKRDGTIVERRP